MTLALLILSGLLTFVVYPRFKKRTLERLMYRAIRSGRLIDDLIAVIMFAVFPLVRLAFVCGSLFLVFRSFA